jgi:hypothetical protein
MPAAIRPNRIMKMSFPRTNFEACDRVTTRWKVAGRTKAKKLDPRAPTRAAMRPKKGTAKAMAAVAEMRKVRHRFSFQLQNL